MEYIRRAAQPYRFHLPAELHARFRELRAQQSPWSDVIEAEDVLHLYYGLGPAYFLAFDGRVIVDDYFMETGIYELSDPKEAWASVAVGAKLLGEPLLLQLLPDRPSAALDCINCKGQGWIDQQAIVCWECGSLGWIDA